MGGLAEKAFQVGAGEEGARKAPARSERWMKLSSSSIDAAGRSVSDVYFVQCTRMSATGRWSREEARESSRTYSRRSSPRSWRSASRDILVGLCSPSGSLSRSTPASGRVALAPSANARALLMHITTLARRWMSGAAVTHGCRVMPLPPTGRTGAKPAARVRE